MTAFHEIRISAVVKRKIERLVFQDHAQHEICGLLGGKAIGPGIVRATSLHPIANRSDNPLSFVIDAYTFRQTVSAIAQLGNQPLAVYHTHPDGNSDPSFRDLEIPQITGLAILIFAGHEAGIKAAGYGFDGKIHPITIRVAPNKTLR